MRSNVNDVLRVRAGVQLLDKLDEASLEKLRGAVAMCEPDVYEYDLKYINETIGWQTLGQTHPSSRPAASG